jgi:peptide/nickel transport system substrate-binding protein
VRTSARTTGKGVVASVALAAAVALALPDGIASGTDAAGGGTLRIVTPADVESLDPALVVPGSLMWFLWPGACATLMSFRDAAAHGYKVRPEAAARPPRISSDRRTYVFTVRKGLRFSNGKPLTAVNFKLALDRIRKPARGSYGAVLFSDVKRVSASRRRLRIALRRPGGDLRMRLALPYACPVPRGFPARPAEVPLVGVGSGPYYVAGHELGKQLVLERNRRYRGPRPQRIGRVLVRIGGTIEAAIRAVEQEQADVVGAEIPRRAPLVAKYGINKRQFKRISGTVPYPLVFNTSRPLFRGNAALRKAVNFALDRTAIVRRSPEWRISAQPTDQILPSWLPGWVDRRLYPLHPDLKRARSLAKGNLRDGKAVLYVLDIPSLYDRATVIAQNLKEIGLDVTLKPLAPEVLEAKAGTHDEPFDLLLTRYGPLDYPDPADVIIRSLSGANAHKPTGNTNHAYFDHPVYNRRMAKANRLTGPARLRAFSRLEADLMRKAAPWAPLLDGSSWLFVSKRVGCFEKPHPVLRMDYPAVCLRW